MRFICLCPTYKKPWSLVGQAVEFFLKQRHKDAFLIIYDDLGSLEEQSHENWSLISTTDREPDIISKYSKMMDMSDRFGKFDALALWDDDDIYMPSHLEFHESILKDKELSYPSKVFTTHKATSEPDGRRLEESRGRFWASSAMRMDAFLRYGFLNTKISEFDLVNLARWRKSCSSGDPCSLGEPTYVYRWEDTGCWHSSYKRFMRHRGDEEWYERIAKQ